MTEGLLDGVEVRRDGGQAGYGPWLRVASGDVPGWIGDMIADMIAQHGVREGVAGQASPAQARAGSRWAWRKR